MNGETDDTLNRTIAIAAIIAAVAAVLTLVVAWIGTVASLRMNQPNVSIYATVYEENGSEYLWVRFYNKGAATSNTTFGYLYRDSEDFNRTWLPSRLSKKAPMRLERNSSFEFAIHEDELSYFLNSREDSIRGFGAILANNQYVWFKTGEAMDFFQRHK